MEKACWWNEGVMSGKVGFWRALDFMVFIFFVFDKCF